MIDANIIKINVPENIKNPTVNLDVGNISQSGSNSEDVRSFEQFLQAGNLPTGASQASSSYLDLWSEMSGKFVSGMQHIEVKTDKAFSEAIKIISQGEITVQDLLKTQIELAQASLMTEVVSKSVSKIDNGITTLFKNQ